MQLSVDHLLALVGPFRDRMIANGRKLSVSHLSTLLFNDGKRLKRMFEKKGDIGSRKLIESFQWFSDNWPDGAEWPDQIPRPSLSPAPRTTKSDEARANP